MIARGTIVPLMSLIAAVVFMLCCVPPSYSLSACALLGFLTGMRNKRIAAAFWLMLANIVIGCVAVRLMGVEIDDIGDIILILICASVASLFLFFAGHELGSCAVHKTETWIKTRKKMRMLIQEVERDYRENFETSPYRSE